ncbi:BTB/POZ domain-containing protein SR1IP1 isoform X2 [Neltuma alba]|uniref:BTB/POZ domain-containing protein SR1IP1 isoform X2 n=1 Tax=Neltuma alba TaxID=207710 RepID=UPI0010A53151|nr:BTB/POZ domain-containing protein SR1IP1 isoform X2 [Prosopis alba]
MFPLASKCGYIRKLISASNHTDASIIELRDVPGGAEAFELAAKFCYGINFEMSVENIAMLRCVAEYLEMTEDYSVRNLVGRTDAYLNEVALKTLPGAVSVLHKSENLIPIAERAKLVSRCIDAIAYMACEESQLYTSRDESGTEDIISSMASHQRDIIDWWAEDLTVLRIDIFQRVLIAMMARGFEQFALGPMLMLYAQKSLRGINCEGKKIEAGEEHEKRVVLETIVSLLPREKNAVSVSFISTLLRQAIYLETTVACRLDLEKRMAMQLGQAALDDLLIPTYSLTGDTLFDVDTVQRILMKYHESDAGKNLASSADSEYFSPPQTDVEWVGKLIENYLAEIATDRNLPVTKFVSLAELIPEQSRPVEDGIYRAIDIYLKAHPALSDMERKKVCSVMDCQKLSRVACSHAAQNDRLPVQTVVQVLYYEQQRLRDAMEGSPSAPSKFSLYPADADHFPNDVSNLKKENKELKSELVKLRMKLREIDMSTPMSAVNSPASNASPSADKFLVPRKSLINSLSKKLLTRLSPFLRAKDQTKSSKNRRHSIS